MADAFPLVKLTSLLFRQISKPIANAVKRRAKTSPIFRTWICMPPAQVVHWLDVHVGRRLMNMEAPTKVSRLSEQKAIETGADLIGEFCIFGIAGLCLTAEYFRGNASDANKDAVKNNHLLSLETRLQEVGSHLEVQEVQLRELIRLFAAAAESRKRPFPQQLLDDAMNEQDTSAVRYGDAVTDLKGAQQMVNVSSSSTKYEQHGERNEVLMDAALQAFEESLDDFDLDLDFGGSD